MKHSPMLALLLAGILSPGLSMAHHGDGTGDLGNLGRGIGIETGSMIEIGHDAPVHILVGASFSGVKFYEPDHHTHYRYFWVSFQGFVPVGGDGSSPVLPMMGINLTPVTRITTTHEGTTSSIRFSPIEIRRDVSSGINSSVSVQAIGMAYAVDRPLVGEFNEEQKAEFEKYARIAVDILGLRFAQTTNEENFWGGQVGSVQALTGLRWNLNEKTALSLALGGRSTLSFGKLGDADGLASLYEVDVFAQVQLLLAGAFVPMQFRLEGGYHLFGLSQAHDHSAESTDEHSHSHGHPYLVLSAGLFF
jgi:hypothetical protein